MALEREFLPKDDPRCGVFSQQRQYGGSVPEGWLEVRTLVLADAVVTAEDYDVESNTSVSIHALSEARAAALKAAARRLVAQGTSVAVEAPTTNELRPASAPRDHTPAASAPATAKAPHG